MATRLFGNDQVVGKYRIVGELGRGAMGTVFKAVDETLDREVAIKVLNPELASAKFIKRFETEATTLAKLNHPAIATIHELVRSANGLLMVMEFVRGETLEKISDRVGALAPARAASIVDNVLAGLAYAHRAGIVHCDVKPANVIVTAHGVKIMDFGVARVRGAGHVLPDGYVIGTPAYMAPEQILGEAVDMRTDLYSVGVVFYRLLTGVLPFAGDTPTEMVREQLSAPPTPLHVYRDGLPGWCEPILQRALAKTPAGRFQTADEFREALTRAIGVATTTDLAADLPGLVRSALSVTDRPARRMQPGLSEVEGPALSGVEGSEAEAEEPVLSEGEGPGLSDVEGPVAARTGAGAAAVWAFSSANRATVVVRDTPHALAYAGLALLVTCGGLVSLVGSSHPALATPAAPLAARPVDPSIALAKYLPAPAPLLPSRVLTRSRNVLRSRPLPLAFDAKALVASGKRREKQDAKVVLADGMISVQARDNTILYSVPYEDVLSISYSEGRDPLWNGPSGPARVASAGGGVFGVFRASRHWVTVRTTNAGARFVTLLFPTDERARDAMAALEQRTGCSPQVVAKGD